MQISRISSGKKGPIIGVVGLTHGNEIVGLDIFEYIRTLECLVGEIILIPANIKAYDYYVAQDDPLKFRYIHHDLNRIWNDTFVEGSYEYQRREELKSVLQECDIIIDIHSVSLGEDVLGIADKKSIESAQVWMDVEKILFQSDQSSSLTAWCTRQGKMSFGLEAGNHISIQGKESGIRNIKNMLIHFGMIADFPEKHFLDTDTLEFLEEIKIETDEFRYAESFKGFNIITPGQIIGYDGEKVIKNEHSFSVIYGLVAKSPQKGGGAGFLFTIMP